MRRITILLLLVLSLNVAYGCDVCGGGNANSGGLLNSLKQNNITISHTFSKYMVSPREGFKATDNFHTIRLSGRYYFHPRFSLNASIPYLHKTREANSVFKEKSGIGDVQFNGNYTLVNDTLNKVFWDIGLGIELKNGKYDNNIIDDDLPKAFNAGNGSISFPISSRFMFRKGTNGLSVNVGYNLNRSTYTDYKFGNYGILSSYVFREFSYSKGKLIPNIGVQYNFQEKDQYANGNKNPDSGFQSVNLTIGLNFIEVGS